jgi:hypothetical protein
VAWELQSYATDIRKFFSLLFMSSTFPYDFGFNAGQSLNFNAGSHLAAPSVQVGERWEYWGIPAESGGFADYA